MMAASNRKGRFFMLKKLLLILVALIFTTNFAFADNNYFDLSKVNDGIIKINYETSGDNKIKIMIQKDNNRAFYDIGTFNQYPLTFGNGNYIVALLENTTGTKYKVISYEKFEITIDKPENVYVNPIFSLNWNDDMSVINKAKELTKELKTDKEKAVAVYNYLVKNFKYDYKKINNIDNSYMPNLENIFKNKLGICSDFSSLYAVMLRSLNIPTKFVKGYKNDIDSYHAWNEVYLDNEWITVDITYDIALYTNEIKYSFEKTSDDYIVKSEY